MWASFIATSLAGMGPSNGGQYCRKRIAQLGRSLLVTYYEICPDHLTMVVAAGFCITVYDDTQLPYKGILDMTNTASLPLTSPFSSQECRHRSVFFGSFSDDEYNYLQNKNANLKTAPTSSRFFELLPFVLDTETIHHHPTPDHP